MTYTLDGELEGVLNLMVLCYARRYPDQRTGKGFAALPTDPDPHCQVDEEATRQRAYGRLEGLLIALGRDPSDPSIQVNLHEEINTARFVLTRLELLDDGPPPAAGAAPGVPIWR